MLASAGRRVSAKGHRYPPKANLRSPAFDLQLVLTSAGLRRQIVKFRGKVPVVAQGGAKATIALVAVKML